MPGVALLLSTILLFGVLVASVGLTCWFRKRALGLAILDVPNARSSHTAAVQPGGGAVIVLSTLAALLVPGLTGTTD